MTSEQFDSLVRSLELQLKRNPRRFVWGTALFAALGYSYLILVLVSCVVLTVGVVALAVLFPNGLTLKLGIVLGLLFGSLSLTILRSLWVRLHTPEGIALTMENAPGLIRLIGSLQETIGSARFHRVLLGSQYNASVTQVPRLGLFGWHRNYLMLGLPLMQSMRPKEFEAVLVHEFAHLAGGHGRFGNWLYRLRRSWEQLLESLARQQSGGSKILTVFLRWFWPRFNARAFVLSRANEYEADALAARLAGPSEIASALKRISVYERHLDESFWERVYRRASREPEPPPDIYAEMPAVLRAGPAADAGEKWMRQAFLIHPGEEAGQGRRLDRNPPRHTDLRAPQMRCPRLRGVRSRIR